MDLNELVRDVPDFGKWKHTDKIKFFAWHLHTNCNRERFTQADVRVCYDELHLSRPTNITSQLNSLANNSKKDLLHDKQGYRLASHVRQTLDSKYGQRASTVQLHSLLSELSTKVPEVAQREFLDEAIICFRYGAFRAAIVMCWNLSFDHLCNWILSEHLKTFNEQLPKSYSKAKIKEIKAKEDFEELKEYEVLQVCRSSQITTSGVHKVLTQKLETRNSAAHPSNIDFNQLQVEEFISTLITNVVLKLKQQK